MMENVHLQENTPVEFDRLNAFNDKTLLSGSQQQIKVEGHRLS